MKSMPYQLKQKLRQYNKAVAKSKMLHDELVREISKYKVPYDYLVANREVFSEHPQTEALAYINNAEGCIEDNIEEIEKIFLYFTNLDEPYEEDEY